MFLQVEQLDLVSSEVLPPDYGSVQSGQSWATITYALALPYQGQLKDVSTAWIRQMVITAGVATATD
ncbi:unnamed protein product, partial [Nesidiocoris tenuis]